MRFRDLQGRDLTTLRGEVRRVSANSFIDEKTGEAYFDRGYSRDPQELDEIAVTRNPDLARKPAIPWQSCPLQKRTGLPYPLQPMAQALWRSSREA